METFKDILSGQIETMQTYFDMCAEGKIGDAVDEVDGVASNAGKNFPQLFFTKKFKNSYTLRLNLDS